jgi:E3 ubiquitin-protein ligase DOA10
MADVLVPFSVGALYVPLFVVLRNKTLTKTVIIIFKFAFIQTVDFSLAVIILFDIFFDIKTPLSISFSRPFSSTFIGGGRS